MIRKLNLVPRIDAGFLPNDVIEEFAKHEVSTHYQDDMVTVDWDEDEEDDNWGYPAFKKYLIETYGEEVKQYDSFAIKAT